MGICDRVCATRWMIALQMYSIRNSIHMTVLYCAAQTQVGTPYYLSPEICQNREYTATTGSTETHAYRLMRITSVS